MKLSSPVIRVIIPGRLEECVIIFSIRYFFPVTLYLPLFVHLHAPYLFIIIQKQAIHMHEYHTVDISQYPPSQKITISIHLPFIKSQSYKTHIKIFEKLSQSVFPSMFVKNAHNYMEEELNISSPRNTF